MFYNPILVLTMFSKMVSYKLQIGQCTPFVNIQVRNATLYIMSQNTHFELTFYYQWIYVCNNAEQVLFHNTLVSPLTFLLVGGFLRNPALLLNIIIWERRGEGVNLPYNNIRDNIRFILLHEGCIFPNSGSKNLNLLIPRPYRFSSCTHTCMLLCFQQGLWV